jgi:D-glycero-D-manno-heptose 1,7-bisphosphate phosphatase
MRDWPQRPRPKWRAAAFIDRDGTIAADTHFPHRVSELALLPRSLDAFVLLAPLPLHIIVVSNQAGIALGMFTRQQMSEYNAELRKQVESAGARIDAFYYCPHKEPKHLDPGEQPCPCAKPAPGMLLEAQNDFGLDLGSSFMIGDKRSDIAAGKAAGCSTVLVHTGKAGVDDGEGLTLDPDHSVADLFEAARHIVATLDVSERAAREGVGR